MEGKYLSGSFSSSNAFPLYMNRGVEGKLLAGGLSAENAFPRRGRKASARCRPGQERLPAICNEEACKGSLCQLACWPGTPSRYILYEDEAWKGSFCQAACPLYMKTRCGRDASARCRAGRGCLLAMYGKGVEGKPLPGGLSTENDFLLYMKTRRGREASARRRAGRECLPAIYIYEDGVCKASLCQLACWPGTPSRYILYEDEAWKGSFCQAACPLYMKTRCGRDASARRRAGRGFSLCMEKAWKGSLCQAACRPRMPSCYI